MLIEYFSITIYPPILSSTSTHSLPSLCHHSVVHVHELFLLKKSVILKERENSRDISYEDANYCIVEGLGINRRKPHLITHRKVV